MPSTLPDLWPEFVTNIDVLTPLAILRFQAGQLRAKTKGLIEAEVRTERENASVTHELILIAPALDRYEYVVANFNHDAVLVYPVNVSSRFCQGSKWCDSQDKLLNTVSEILSDAGLRAVISSLIAQSRDITDKASLAGLE